MGCIKCDKAPGFHAGLHVGHIWTEVACPAYRTLNGADCTCGSRGFCCRCVNRGSWSGTCRCECH